MASNEHERHFDSLVEQGMTPAEAIKYLWPRLGRYWSNFGIVVVAEWYFQDFQSDPYIKESIYRYIEHLGSHDSIMYPPTISFDEWQKIVEMADKLGQHDDQLRTHAFWRMYSLAKTTEEIIVALRFAPKDGPEYEVLKKQTELS